MDEALIRSWNDELKNCKEALKKQYDGLDYTQLTLTHEQMFDLKLTLAIAMHNLHRLDEEVSRKEERKPKFQLRSW